MFFELKETIARKESKLYATSFFEARLFFLKKENFNTTRNGNVYSDIV